jgi:SAM-dependent methyltransferase
MKRSALFPARHGRSISLFFPERGWARHLPANPSVLGADSGTIDAAVVRKSCADAESTAWTFAISRRLPSPPFRVLDKGAGTGILSLSAARLVRRGAAPDLSSVMLDRLQAKAQAEGLEIGATEGRADQHPHKTWEVVILRRLPWVLSDSAAALRGWRRTVLDGIRFWDPQDQVRNQAHRLAKRILPRSKPCRVHYSQIFTRGFP